MLPDAQSRVVITLLVSLSLLTLNFRNVNAMPRQDDQDEVVVTMSDIQRLGEANLDDATRGYIGGGAGQERTLNENIAAFSRLRFRPRSLVDVSKMTLLLQCWVIKYLFLSASPLLLLICYHIETGIRNCKSGTGRGNRHDPQRCEHSLIGRRQSQRPGLPAVAADIHIQEPHLHRVHRQEGGASRLCCHCGHGGLSRLWTVFIHHQANATTYGWPQICEYGSILARKTIQVRPFCGKHHGRPAVFIGDVGGFPVAPFHHETTACSEGYPDR
uniref:Putative secreted protein n=1 Tax=Rhipicephalus microplus TaxID=6941 RepID=A0A6G4ZWK5_RHIMP